MPTSQDWLTNMREFNSLQDLVETKENVAALQEATMNAIDEGNKAGAEPDAQDRLWTIHTALDCYADVLAEGIGTYPTGPAAPVAPVA